ncbi:unnamed protein product [Alternaria alternata]
MVSPKRKKGSQYYAVVTGRLDEPTIFSSWYASLELQQMALELNLTRGDVHPRVTDCENLYQSFCSIQEARGYMEQTGCATFKEVIKETALDTTPTKHNMAYYAVANGANPGIYDVWDGPGGAQENVHEFPGACHKKFRTKEQAEAFIEDWKETYAEVWRRALKKALDEGLRPQDLKLDTQRTLCGAYQDPAIEDISERFDSVMSLT